MPTYTYPSGLSDKFTDALREVSRMVKLFNEDTDEQCVVDLANCKFTYPIFLSALASMRLKKEIAVIPPVDNFAASYITTVKLMKPTTVDDLNPAFIDYYSNKSFLPIVIYPATRFGNAINQRETALQALLALLEKQNATLDKKILEGLHYFIIELVNNTVDHSGEDVAILFAQHFASKNYIDLCIVDSGKSILGSYLELDSALNINAAEAIDKALSGESTKDRPQSERGYGIRTSKKALMEGLQGNFFLWSNRGLLIDSQITELPETLSWNGTFVFLRIPTNIVGFSLSKYLEG